MGESVYARALRRAADVVGGKSTLREQLRVPMSELERWMAGADKPPMDVFLKAVDIISAAPPAGSAVERSRELREEAEQLRIKTAANLARAQAMRSVILERRPVSSQARPTSALSFFEKKFEPGEGGAMVEAALDAAISATHAHKGNVQLVCPDGLRIVAQRGFEQPFLDFFALVEERGRTVCGVARMAAQRISVPDVSRDILFAGTPAGAALAAAGVRAVQSTPLVGSGEVLGMLSTHYAAPHELTEHDEDMLDHIAHRAVFWLEGGAL